MIENERIPKLILLSSNIGLNNGFNASRDFNKCSNCGSNIFYIKSVFGIVAENQEYMVLNNKEKRTFCLREIGFDIYCAECGDYCDDFHQYIYKKDDLVMSFDELEDYEKEEVGYCLAQYNQKHDFTQNYKATNLNLMKEKLNEWVKEHPIKEDKKVKNKIYIGQY
jgi:hypothetical protein